MQRQTTQTINNRLDSKSLISLADHYKDKLNDLAVHSKLNAEQRGRIDTAVEALITIKSKIKTKKPNNLDDVKKDIQNILLPVADLLNEKIETTTNNENVPPSNTSERKVESKAKVAEEEDDEFFEADNTPVTTNKKPRVAKDDEEDELFDAITDAVADDKKPEEKNKKRPRHIDADGDEFFESDDNGDATVDAKKPKLDKDDETFYDAVSDESVTPDGDPKPKTPEVIHPKRKNTPVRKYQPIEEVNPLSPNAAYVMGDVLGDLITRAKSLIEGELYRAKLSDNLVEDFTEYNAKLNVAENIIELFKRFDAFQRLQTDYDLKAEQIDLLIEVEKLSQDLEKAIRESENCHDKKIPHISDESIERVVPEGMDVRKFIYDIIGKIFKGENTHTAALITDFATAAPSKEKGQKVNFNSTYLAGLGKVITTHTADNHSVTSEVFVKPESESVRLPRTKNWFFGSVSIPNSLLIAKALIMATDHREKAIAEAKASAARTHLPVDMKKALSVRIDVDNIDMKNDEYLALLIACRHKGLDCSRINTIDDAQWKLFLETLEKSSVLKSLPEEVRRGAAELEREEQTIKHIFKVELQAASAAKKTVDEETPDAATADEESSHRPSMAR